VRAIEQALEHGVKVFGVTVHLVDEGVDTGPIVLQRAVDLADARDPAVVRAALRPIEHDLLPRAVALMAAGRLRRDPAHPRRVVLDEESGS
jgi:phosphoribosylglycinamide formyltransferase-1